MTSAPTRRSAPTVSPLARGAIDTDDDDVKNRWDLFVTARAAARRDRVSKDVFRSFRSAGALLRRTIITVSINSDVQLTWPPPIQVRNTSPWPWPYDIVLLEVMEIYTTHSTATVDPIVQAINRSLASFQETCERQFAAIEDEIEKHPNIRFAAIDTRLGVIEERLTSLESSLNHLKSTAMGLTQAVAEYVFLNTVLYLY
ncbi:hypothetical protein F4803DRAFT_553150 [Xylaria telfairii]|nr:hypothetical protein F4803DRAFT_553150 [Xylaria telfairii]